MYRTSAGSKAVDYLIDAARNGKEVAVVVELKAKFDEAANIRWASRLNAVGIHVTYGVVGLKTHCKAVLVVRQDYDGFRRYAHVGTGNYHAGTSRLYSDFGLLTCDEDIGRDLTELFNYLTTGYKPKRSYRKILPAPKILKRALLDRIEREIQHHEQGEQGHIQFKMNALEDREVTRALYRASRIGVRVDLIVRDTCRLRPGLPGLSETANVVSVVGRFLEHGRLYYFRNGGDEEYYIGSADAMSRNLNSRVELVAPVEDPALRAELPLLPRHPARGSSGGLVHAPGRQLRAATAIGCRGRDIIPGGHDPLGGSASQGSHPASETEAAAAGQAQITSGPDHTSWVSTPNALSNRSAFRVASHISTRGSASAARAIRMVGLSPDSAVA